jgi:hypothetical protein
MAIIASKSVERPRLVKEIMRPGSVLECITLQHWKQYGITERHGSEDAEGFCSAPACGVTWKRNPGSLTSALYWDSHHLMDPRKASEASVLVPDVGHAFVSSLLSAEGPE